MSKVFMIPDVHLKPWMFERASELVDRDFYDAVVMLGDLVDDWGQGNLLTLDTFSTDIDGMPYGDQRFVWIDTAKKTWEYVEE